MLSSDMSRSNGHGRVRVVVAVVLALAALAAVVAVLFIGSKRSEVSISIDAPYGESGGIPIVANVEDESGNVVETLSFVSPEAQVVRLGSGSYSVVVDNSPSLFPDGVSAYGYVPRNSFDVRYSDVSVSLDVGKVDVTDSKAIDDMVNGIAGDDGEQERAYAAYSALAKEALSSSGSDVAETDVYRVHDVSVSETSPGVVEIRGVIDNISYIDMYLLEINFTILGMDGMEVGTTKFICDALYGGQTMEFVAEGFVTPGTALDARVDGVVYSETLY